jgi:CheY-like chemotaxis protein
MNDSAAAVPFAHDSKPNLRDRCILLVEDETVLAFLVEDMLADLGCRQVLYAASVPEALALLRQRRPDAAVLDVNVKNEMVYPVAENLAAAQIPFLFATGYGRGGIPEPWHSVTVIQKPFVLATLAAALDAILGR